MLEKTSYSNHKIPEGLEKLKKEKLYLYGNGVTAERIFAQLNQWNIKIEGVIVSDGYATNPNFHGFKVLPFSKLEGKTSIVAGYSISANENLTKFLLHSNIVEKIYCLEGFEVFLLDRYLRNDIILLDDYYRISMKRKLDERYFQENYEGFMQTYHWLADEKSKKVMECYLRGHIELKEWPMLEVWNKKDVEAQYFPDDIIKLSQHETVVDCGAFTGDTLKTFAEKVETFNHYYAWEPDPNRFDELNQRMKEVSFKGKVTHVPFGAFDEKKKLYFDNTVAASGKVVKDLKENSDCICICVERIDNFTKKNEQVSLIKMDIEGSELQALKGAENTIKNYKPKLAICVYHKREDLFTIPQYIKGLVPEYKLFLRAHFPSISEVVLYAICE